MTKDKSLSKPHEYAGTPAPKPRVKKAGDYSGYLTPVKQTYKILDEAGDITTPEKPKDKYHASASTTT